MMNLPASLSSLGLLVAVFGAGILSVPGATAQTLDPPIRTATCDPATATYLPDGEEAAVCARRTYRLPVTDTVRLRQDRYDEVAVTAWDSAAVQVEAIVVARRATADSAEGDLKRIQLRRTDGTMEATGPSDDAPGWWSVGYRLRVPPLTTLAITSGSAAIAVDGVVGAHTLRSEDGHIRFTLPADAGARLEATTDYGTIDVGFPVTTQGAISERLEAVVGEGGPTVRLVSGDDITIRRAP